VPVALPLTGDQGATAGNAYRPGFAGTSLYTADLPPGIRIGLHRQQSVDYIAVLAGRIDLVLPRGRKTLRTGDVLVQAANLHGWENPYAEAARILVVVMTAAAAPTPAAAH
jgi:quercetin dioxygenase-like cupin family protein